MPLPAELQLSPEGQAVWCTMARYVIAHGHAPSHRDLQRALGRGSSVVQDALVEMECKGYLWPRVRRPRPARSYCLRVWPREMVR